MAKMVKNSFFKQFFFSIRPPPGLLPVFGPLTRYMTPTLDAALLMCGSPERGRATSYVCFDACNHITHVCGHKQQVL